MIKQTKSKCQESCEVNCKRCEDDQGEPRIVEMIVNLIGRMNWQNNTIRFNNGLESCTIVEWMQTEPVNTRC